MSTFRAGGPAPRRWGGLRGARGANVLIALGLGGLLALVTATAPRWSLRLRQTLPAGDEEPPAPAPEASAAPDAAPRRTIKVKLFFETPDGRGLALEEREVPFAGDLARQIQIVAEEMVQGPQGGELLAPLPAETRVLGAFVTRAGVAYVNFSKEAQAGGAGSHSELLSVFAFVDSLTSNFPAVKRVQLLVEDRPADTLWGHVDLNRPLVPDLTLLAAMEAFPLDAAPAQAPPAPAGGPSPAAPAAAAASPVAGAAR